MSTPVKTRFVGNTEPVLDTIRREVLDPQTGTTFLARVDLSPAGTTVRFMRQDSATGTVIVDAPATILQTVDPETWGDVEYDPVPLEVASPVDSVCWWRVTINGVVQDTPEWVERIVPHGIAAPTTTETPTQVCQPWATNADVARYNQLEASDLDYSAYLVEASELLWAMSARQYSGNCTRTVRPARTQPCTCFQVLSRGHIVAPPQWEWLGGRWCAEGESWATGCGTVPSVRLPGYATSVDQVKLSGVVVDPATYRLDRHSLLVRLTDPATGDNPGWPLCQNMALPDDAAGTFSIRYEYGRVPPASGVRAAAQLAYQLYLSDNAAGACSLPAGWTTVSRQGVTVSRRQVQELATQGSGIVGIDAFLSTVNPRGLDRPPAVYSRDVTPFPYSTG